MIDSLQNCTCLPSRRLTFEWSSPRKVDTGLPTTAKVKTISDMPPAYNDSMRPQGTPQELERRRQRAVQLVDAGECPSVVARILGVTPSSLSRWRRLARQADGLTAKPIPGRMPRWRDEQLRALETLLPQEAVAHGWADDLWTAKRVAVLIERHFGRLEASAPIADLLYPSCQSSLALESVSLVFTSAVVSKSTAVPRDFLLSTIR
jgi:transposase